MPNKPLKPGRRVPIYRPLHKAMATAIEAVCPVSQRVFPRFAVYYLLRNADVASAELIWVKVARIADAELMVFFKKGESHSPIPLSLH